MRLSQFLDSDYDGLSIVDLSYIDDINSEVQLIKRSPKGTMTIDVMGFTVCYSSETMLENFMKILNKYYSKKSMDSISVSEIRHPDYIAEILGNYIEVRNKDNTLVGRSQVANPNNLYFSFTENGENFLLKDGDRLMVYTLPSWLLQIDIKVNILAMTVYHKNKLAEVYMVGNGSLAVNLYDRNGKNILSTTYNDTTLREIKYFHFYNGFFYMINLNTKGGLTVTILNKRGKILRNHETKLSRSYEYAFYDDKFLISNANFVEYHDKHSVLESIPINVNSRSAVYINFNMIGDIYYASDADQWIYKVDQKKFYSTGKNYLSNTNTPYLTNIYEKNTRQKLPHGITGKDFNMVYIPIKNIIKILPSLRIIAGSMRRQMQPKVDDIVVYNLMKELIYGSFPSATKSTFDLVRDYIFNRQMTVSVEQLVSTLYYSL